MESRMCRYCPMARAGDMNSIVQGTEEKEGLEWISEIINWLPTKHPVGTYILYVG